jgi:hypothetical protein
MFGRRCWPMRFMHFELERSCSQTLLRDSAPFGDWVERVERLYNAWFRDDLGPLYTARVLLDVSCTLLPMRLKQKELGGLGCIALRSALATLVLRLR